MKSLPECEEHVCEKKVVLEENSRKITFLNNEQHKIIKIKIDGCVIRDNQTPRCDYALVPFPDLEVYVELKGKEIQHAVEQIRSTILLLSDDPQKIRKLCFIISSRVPKQGTDIQQLKRKFKKEFYAVLNIKNNQDTYNLTKHP